MGELDDTRYVGMAGYALVCKAYYDGLVAENAQLRADVQAMTKTRDHCIRKSIGETVVTKTRDFAQVIRKKLASDSDLAAAVKQESLNADRESLDQQILDIHSEHPELVKAVNLSRLDDATKRALLADMREVLDRRDAARYRFLRENSVPEPQMNNNEVHYLGVGTFPEGTTFDDAVDLAMGDAG